MKIPTHTSTLERAHTLAASNASVQSHLPHTLDSALSERRKHSKDAANILGGRQRRMRHTPHATHTRATPDRAVCGCGAFCFVPSFVSTSADTEATGSHRKPCGSFNQLLYNCIPSILCAHRIYLADSVSVCIEPLQKRVFRSACVLLSAINEINAGQSQRTASPFKVSRQSEEKNHRFRWNCETVYRGEQHRRTNGETEKIRSSVRLLYGRVCASEYTSAQALSVCVLQKRCRRSWAHIAKT